MTMAAQASCHLCAFNYEDAYNFCPMCGTELFVDEKYKSYRSCKWIIGRKATYQNGDSQSCGKALGKLKDNYCACAKAMNH